MNGKKSDPIYTDYLMSRDFGLDWQDYDLVRMQDFIQIKIHENERDTKDQKKSSSQKFRKRG